MKKKKKTGRQMCVDIIYTGGMKTLMRNNLEDKLETKFKRYHFSGFNIIWNIVNVAPFSKTNAWSNFICCFTLTYIYGMAQLRILLYFFVVFRLNLSR